MGRMIKKESKGKKIVLFSLLKRLFLFYFSFSPLTIFFFTENNT